MKSESISSSNIIKQHSESFGLSATCLHISPPIFDDKDNIKPVTVIDVFICCVSVTHDDVVEIPILCLPFLCEVMNKTVNTPILYVFLYQI